MNTIFYIDDNGNEKQISKEWYFIYSNLFEGENEYYIVSRYVGGYFNFLIFHKNNENFLSPIEAFFKYSNLC